MDGDGRGKLIEKKGGLGRALLERKRKGRVA